MTGRHRARQPRPWSGVALTGALALISGAAVIVPAPQPNPVTPAAQAGVQRVVEPRPSRSYSRPPLHHNAPAAAHTPRASGGGAFPSPEPTPHRTFTARPRLNPDRAVVIRYALRQLGDPYRYGGTGPDAFDCSGLVQAAFAAAGYAMPRVSSAQHAMGNPAPISALDPGDLAAWPGHVAIYLGGGRIVEAATPGTVVRVRALGNAFDLAAWGVSLDYSRLPRG